MTTKPSNAVRRNSHACTFLVSIVLVVGSGSAYAEDLTWVVAPYVWAADVGLDLAINNEPVLGNEATFNDLLDKVEVAFTGHAEVRGERSLGRKRRSAIARGDRLCLSPVVCTI
jgi:hypothetical protein